MMNKLFGRLDIATLDLIDARSRNAKRDRKCVNIDTFVLLDRLIVFIKRSFIQR